MLPSSCFGYSNWSGRATDDDDFESFLYSPTNEEQINTSEEINLNINNSINTTDRNQHQSICQNNTVPVQSINSSYSRVSMVEKNEYTCLSCRKLHRKCDKLLPSCSYCSKRGYKCIYEKPKRSVKPNQPNFVFVDEGRKLTNHRISQPTAATTNESVSSLCENSKNIERRGKPYVNIVNNRIENNATSINALQNELNYRFVTTQTLDVYFNVIACGMPLVERKKLEQVLEYQSNLYHPSFSISGCDFYTNQFEFEKDQSLLFTLQALCLQQMGHRDVSTQLYLQGKQLLGKYFDDIDSISVLLSMKFTSLYLLGEGERRKARAMMLIVKAGIDPYLLKNEKVKEISDLELILKNAKSFTSLLIESQLKLIDLYLNEECYPDTYLFEAIEELSNRKLKFTDEERSRGCKKLNKETYEKIKGFMKAYMSLSRIFVESERNDADNAGNLLMLSLSITTKQIWLEILLNSDESFRDLNEILQISSEIIGLTRTKFFPYLQINATKGIILAATLRASYYYKLGPNENVNDDLRALKSLSTKYKYIQTECVDLMKALETLTYMSLNSGSLSNPFSVDEICNFTSKIEPTTLKAPTEGGMIVYYNDYVENHRPNLNQVMKEDTDLIDELVNCLLDQDKIKKEVIDPIQQKESLHYRKLQLVQTYRNKATDRQDNYQVIEMMKNIRLFYMLQ